jgi:hypothetical protein
LAGASYAFTPTTAPGDTGLTFNVVNLPGWAQFNSRTGELSGTPSSADVGSFTNIVISVSDADGQASLPPFSIAVTQSASGSATLNWTPPTENTDGTPVTNLSGYRIYYGNSAAAINESIQVANAGIATYVVSNLSPGTWYFEVRAYNAANMESSPSAVASKMIN